MSSDPSCRCGEYDISGDYACMDCELTQDQEGQDDGWR